MKLALLATVTAGAILVACSGSSSSSSGGGAGSATFEVVSFSVSPAAAHALNRPIDVVFSDAVDLATVTPNTLRIRTYRAIDPNGQLVGGGEPAAGTYTLTSPDVVRFVPACPTATTDAGLAAGAYYTVLVPGQAKPGPAIRSTAGTPVGDTAGTQFRTPAPNSPELFDDPVAGAPDVVIRDQGSGLLAATYLEIGLDDASRAYFERDGGGQVELPLGFLAPLNRYSLVEDRVAWIAQIDQPVDPSPSNLGPERLRLEGLAAGGAWTPLAVTVDVEENCADDGARLRLTPRGILPQDSAVRLVLDVGFRDLAGEARTTAAEVAVAPIATAFDPGTTTPGDSGDQLFETFAAGGDLPDSYEDTELELGLPRAAWGGGALTAATNFDGTGGPNGTFDWFIPPGTDVILDTVSDTIVGGPDGTPTDTQTVINGVVDIDDFFLPASSRLIVLGPNPLTLLATGTVRIEGEITLRGGNAQGVSTLNTTNQPEPGAAGQAGGGAGGTGSYLTTESTPRGGAGFGPYQVPEGGGQGGETSYASTGKNDRRGAGGGGGRHGVDVVYDPFDLGGPLVRCQSLIGMDVERGALGGPGGLGAESQSERAQGGQPGPVPFLDADPANDFFGVQRLAGGELVRGELDEPLPGSGGGAGGDAVNSDSFPLEPFSNTGDEKGAGGGGGGGLIRVLAVGEIVVEDGGRIIADGGAGNGGENTNFFDRVGGGSGGGSGGAIVLESLTRITVAGGVESDEYRDDPGELFHAARSLSALGGPGGCGNQSKGGANESGPVPWRCDRIPFDHFEGPMSDQIPPFNDNCFLAQPDISDPDGGPTVGAGGDGGPGLIQLHVPDPATDLVFPDAGADLSKVAAPLPVGYDYATQSFTGALLPTFGTTSVAQSRWIPLGLARHDPSGVDDQVLLFFGGTAAATGEVLTVGEDVLLEPPLVGPAVVQSAPATPYVDSNDPFTMVFDAAGIAGFDDVFERNPALLRAATVRLLDAADPDNTQDYTVVEASYDASLDELAVTVAAGAGSLLDFSAPGDVLASLIPRSFQVETGGLPDSIGQGSIRLLFDAARADALGRPDAATSYSATVGDFTSDPAQLNQGPWDFYRFRAFLDVSPSGVQDIGAPAPSLTFLRVPFRF